MARAWFFQANPSIYDIDEALTVLDNIWWRAPQYSGEIRVGDVAMIWRSGKGAGIVAAGVIETEPVERERDLYDTRFFRAPAEGTATYTLLRIQQIPFVAKDSVAQLPSMASHPLVVAPMGTVFPLSAEQWREVATLLPEEVVQTTALVGSPSELSELPGTFAWPQRSKSVYPLPGGFDGYIESLRRICGHIEERQPAADELAQLVQNICGISVNNARAILEFPQ